MLGLDPPEVRDGQATLTLEGGVRLELHTEAGSGGAPAIRDCTLAVPGPGGLDADTTTEAERLLGVRFRAE